MPDTILPKLVTGLPAITIELIIRGVFTPKPEVESTVNIFVPEAVAVRVVVNAFSVNDIVKC